MFCHPKHCVEVTRHTVPRLSSNNRDVRIKKTILRERRVSLAPAVAQFGASFQGFRQTHLRDVLHLPFTQVKRMWLFCLRSPSSGRIPLCTGLPGPMPGPGPIQPIALRVPQTKGICDSDALGWMPSVWNEHDLDHPENWILCCFRHKDARRRDLEEFVSFTGVHVSRHSPTEM